MGTGNWVLIKEGEAILFGFHIPGHWAKRGPIFELRFSNWVDSRILPVWFSWIVNWNSLWFHFASNCESGMNPIIFSTKIHKISAVESQSRIDSQNLIQFLQNYDLWIDWFESQINRKSILIFTNCVDSYVEKSWKFEARGNKPFNFSLKKWKPKISFKSWKVNYIFQVRSYFPTLVFITFSLIFPFPRIPVAFLRVRTFELIL